MQRGTPGSRGEASSSPGGASVSFRVRPWRDAESAIRAQRQHVPPPPERARARCRTRGAVRRRRRVPRIHIQLSSRTECLRLRPRLRRVAGKASAISLPAVEAGPPFHLSIRRSPPGCFALERRVKDRRRLAPGLRVHCRRGRPRAAIREERTLALAVRVVACGEASNARALAPSEKPTAQSTPQWPPTRQRPEPDV